MPVRYFYERVRYGNPCLVLQIVQVKEEVVCGKGTGRYSLGAYDELEQAFSVGAL